MRTYLMLLFISVMCVMNAQDKKPTVCLNMIVKNESHVIRRCLESVKPLIDYWVILDTGSTDGTQEVIQEFMKDIPGELYESPFVNFEYSRNQALDLAKDKADYLLFIDADDILTYAPDFVRPQLDQEFYTMKIDFNGLIYYRTTLARTDMEWRWVGVLHEVIMSNLAWQGKELEGVTMKIIGGGGRSQDPKKYLKDAAVLEKALEEDPESTRTVFYLAQSYRAAGMREKAIEVYEKRVAMGGWDQEVFWSLYQIAMTQEELELPEEVVSNSYCKAFNFRQNRVEPLYKLCSYYRKKDRHVLAYLISKFALNIPLSKDPVFVESWIYDYALLFEYSICTYWVAEYEESFRACQKLLANPNLPDDVRDRVEKNLVFVVDKLPAQKIVDLMREAS